MDTGTAVTVTLPADAENYHVTESSPRRAVFHDTRSKLSGISQCPVMLVQLKSNIQVTQVYSCPDSKLLWSVNFQNGKVAVTVSSNKKDWKRVYVSEALNLKIESTKVHVPTRTIVITDRKGEIHSLKFAKLTDNDEGSVGEIKRIMSHSSTVHCTEITHSGVNDMLFSTDASGEIRCSLLSRPYDFQYYLLGHRKPVVAMKLIHNESCLLSASSDGKIKIWNLDQRACERTYNIFEDSPISLTRKVMDMTISGTGNHGTGSILCALELGQSELKIPVYELSRDRKCFKYLAMVSCGLKWFVGRKLFVYEASSYEEMSKWPLHSEAMTTLLKHVTCFDFGPEAVEGEQQESDLPKAKKVKIESE